MTNSPSIVAVVENDTALLTALDRLLRAHGYHAEVYGSAESFLERQSATRITCLILDIDLDGISGLELQKTLVGTGCAPPIVFITGHGEAHSMRQAQEMGCIAYLIKPFESRQLIQALHQAIQKAE
ncbi:MAG: response regulator [Proteobacteria bacterium]|nr:response regulator [Pseudomonadota bacterium]